MLYQTMIDSIQNNSDSFKNPLGEDEVSFLICVEANRLEPQALLLCESLRTFGGRYRNAPILAVSPRPSLALAPEARARLEALGVTYAVENLNRTGSSYGTINRIVAGAWAEKVSSSPYLIVLDTDMVWTGEPVFARTDAGARPVDLKGSASAGADDPLDAYWARMASFGGIDLARLPRLAATIDQASIRASYNGGFLVVRRDLGILARTKEIFLVSQAENLRPWAGAGLDILASTGFVGSEASEWWGSSQAALSVAIWGKTSNVQIYDERYNIPLHLLVGPGRSWPLRDGQSPLLLHYHYLTEPQYQTQFREVLERTGCSPGVRSWIEDRLERFID